MGDSPGPLRYRLWIGGLSEQVDEHDIEEVASHCGEVVDVRIKTSERDTFAFVQYKNSQDVSAAIAKLDQTVIKGKRVKVAPATKDKKRDDDPRGGVNRCNRDWNGNDGRESDHYRDVSHGRDGRDRYDFRERDHDEYRKLYREPREPRDDPPPRNDRSDSRAPRDRPEDRYSRGNPNRDGYDTVDSRGVRGGDRGGDRGAYRDDYCRPDRGVPPRRDARDHERGGVREFYDNSDRGYVREGALRGYGDRGHRDQGGARDETRGFSPPRNGQCRYSGYGGRRSPTPRSRSPRAEISRKPVGRYTVRIEGLPDDMSWLELKDLGRQYGQSLSFARTYRDGRLSCGTLEYSNRDDAERSVRELHQRRIQDFDGRISAFLCDRDTVQGPR
eukprot:CAMPEP_0194483598 /NCGR_PEP_ID=MMETSP0253-20130528/5139_1 /TAXON_ID=2966 /ORGANISM="Noctiluca scintillans" /LENGTH=386 /DNA_ID=CAMNT_0039323271 /DNA_START=63 /DNA_END=1223 /DNA_ORIENTATION=-